MREMNAGDAKSTEWPNPLVEMFLGRLTPEAALAKILAASKFPSLSFACALPAARSAAIFPLPRHHPPPPGEWRATRLSGDVFHIMTFSQNANGG
jgi:hypothetical protein